MKRSILFLLVLFSLVLTSCSSARYVSDSLKVAKPRDIVLIEPYSDLGLFDRERTVSRDDTLTWDSHETLLDCLEENKALFPYDRIFYFDDKDSWAQTGRDVQIFLHDCQQFSKKNRADIPIPESLAAFMAENNLPYVMLLYHTGWSRSRKDYNLEVAKKTFAYVSLAVASAILTGGAYVPYGYYGTDRYNSRFTVVVANAEEGRAVYYNIVSDDRDPLNYNDDFKMLHRLFKKFPRAVERE